MRAIRISSVLVIGCLLGASLAVAQDPPPDRELPELSGFSVIPFNFGPPGARSLGMGGTFIAIADDATAAEANPAGLTRLTRPEISIHGRQSSFDVEIVDLNATVALASLNRFRDPMSRLRPNSTIGNAFASDNRETFSPSVSEVSFVSYVKPFENYTFSVYMQRSADFSGQSDFTGFDDQLLDLYTSFQSLDLSLDNVGVSAAFEAGEKLSIGFSLRYSALDVTAIQETRTEYLADLESPRLGPGASLEEVRALGIVDQRIAREALSSSDGDITFNVGLLVNPGGKVSLGLVYKDGGEYEIRGQQQEFGCMAPVASGSLQCQPGMDQPTGRRFKVPDFYGLGLAWRATNRFKLALDLDQITYSDLDLGPADPNAAPGVAEQFEKVNDEFEWHLGGEYVLFVGEEKRPVTLRAGVFHEPDHDGFRDVDSEQTALTAGIGWVLKESFQLDLAAQASDTANMGIVSFVYRF